MSESVMPKGAEGVSEAPARYDDDNPEWTAERVARARRAHEVLPPHLMAQLRGGRGPQKAPTKVQVTLRLDRDAVAAFKAEGPGWQTRINDAVVEAARRRA